MKKILITGSAGFIGFHLTKRLSEEDNYEIVTIDNLTSYYDIKLKSDRLMELGFNPRSIKPNSFTQSSKYNHTYFVHGGLEDKALIQRIFNEYEFDIIINLAAQAGVRYSLENPQAYIDSNITGLVNLFEGAKSQNIEHFIYASSSSVYGNNTKVPFEETDRVDEPVSMYATTKRANELMAHSYSHNYGIPCSGLRFFTVYGPWGRPDMAYFKFVDFILEGKPISVFNNGNLKRDFTYIDDIIEGIYRLVKSKATKNQHEIYNIGNSSPVNLMDFIKCIEENIGIEAKKDFKPMQMGDVHETYANTTKLEEKVNYKPKTELAHGIKEFVSWYKSYYKI